MSQNESYSFCDIRGIVMDMEMTRKEFLRAAGFVAFAIFILPGIKKLNLFRKLHKEAKYYKKLAG